MALSRLSVEQDALFEVEEALKRILIGTHGFCEETGKPIPAEHLKAVPWARSVPSARSCRAILRKANWKRTSNRLNPKKKTCGASMSRWAGISTLARAGPAAIATETQEERHKLPGPPRTHRFCEPS